MQNPQSACVLNLYVLPRGLSSVNWGYFILRLVIGLAILGLLFLSQRFWYRAIWRSSAKWKHTALREPLQ